MLLSSNQTVDGAKSALIPLCSELNDKVSENQVFRLAMQIFGTDNACDLKEKELSITKGIWFGSLALIVSTLGVILALAAFVVRDPPSSKKSKRSKFKISLIVTIRRWMYRKRIPKIIEVPVDKIVLRDVPVEVVKREVVHIPVYTNDESLLGKNFTEQSKK